MVSGHSSSQQTHIQLECQFFSLLLVFFFSFGNLPECRMQSEKAVEATWSLWMRALQTHTSISHEE